MTNDIGHRQYLQCLMNWMDFMMNSRMVLNGAKWITKTEIGDKGDKIDYTMPAD